MRLFHSFPRPRKQRKPESSSAQTENASADLILQSILSHGFLCAPERLDIHPHPSTGNRWKQTLLAKGEAEYTHIQSRMCFTLCEERELFERFERGYIPASFTGKRPRLSDTPISSGHFRLGWTCRRRDRLESFQRPTTRLSMLTARDTTLWRPAGPASPDDSETQGITRPFRSSGDCRTFTGRRREELPTDDMLKALNIGLPYQPEIIEKA